MVPGGPLADSFTVRGYPVDSHPLWFGTRKQRDGEPDGGGGGLGTPQGGKGNPGDGGGDEPLDTVFTPKTAVPIGQGSQVVFTPPPPSPPSEHRDASQGASQTSPPPPGSSAGASQGASQTSPPPPGTESNTISAAQQNLLQQNGIWVKTVPQGAGQYVERVNPVVELRKLQRVAEQRNYTETVSYTHLTLPTTPYV